MQPRVIAVLVAQNGAQYLPRTLAALATQTRRPDALIAVDAGSTDGTRELLAAANPAELVSAPRHKGFGAAIARALSLGEPHDNEWLWLLGHDNAPEPNTLAALLGAVEVAPSVAIAGPKQMRWDEPDVIAGFGETLTRFGRSLSVIHDELDQAQHDTASDFLGVAEGGMLVRRSVFAALGGFDRSLTSADAALDFSIRARLAGHRVIGVPSARVASVGPAELFGRRSLSPAAQNQVRRFAQLHRRLVYAAGAAVPLHWLGLLPIALGRSFMHVLTKQPTLIAGEFGAALGAVFDGRVWEARANLARTRKLGWAAIGELRMPGAEVRERQAQERAAVLHTAPTSRVGPGFFVGGGAWVVLVAAIVGFVAFGHFSDAQALTGGGLVPLSSTVGELWSHVGYGWHDVGAGFTGAADPFSYVLAVLGSLTFWSPSTSVVIVYLAALPLAALGAWYCAARFSARAWAPAVAAVAWTAAPPFISALNEGRLGVVLTHILLPVLVLAAVNAARSWSMAAVAALLFAVVAACTPVLVPALLLVLVVWILARPTSAHRLAGIPIPAAVLFAPLIVQQLGRVNPLGLIAEPGVPVLSQESTGWQLALGSSDLGLNGWSAALDAAGAPAGVAPVVAIVALAPFLVLALLALFVPGTARSVPALLIALLGFVTAVIGTHLQVTILGAETTGVWPGAGLSLYWLGLTGAAIVAVEALGRASALPAFLAAIGLVVIGIPAFTSAASGTSAVEASNGRLLPAFVSAEAASRGNLGTLQLTAQSDGVAAAVHRGQGTTLDEQSTLAATDTRLDRADRRLGVLAGNISSRSGFDVASELDALQIGFVLVPDASDGAVGMRHRLVDALDGNRSLIPIGNTADGYLWHYDVGAGTPPRGPSAIGTPLGIGILAVQALVVLMTVLLAIPTTRRARLRAPGATRRLGQTEAEPDDD
ncbi:MAG: glycosyltransferase family 2 protein [Salinibacterium sp.]|nr:MAG: glycosyltransferase family 2 protein [Salinibacterium sp.]